MSIFNSAWTYILSFGAVGFLVLAFLAGPYILPFIQPIGKFLEPVAEAMGKVLGWLLNAVTVGIQDILDTWQTIVTVAVMMLALGWYMHPVYNQTNCSAAVKAATIEYHKKYVWTVRKDPSTYTTNNWLPSWMGF